MQNIKVRRRAIDAENVAGVLRRGLGSGYQVAPDGTAGVYVRKGLFTRAKVSFDDEPGGTAFTVRGQGIFVFPFSVVITRVLNDRGIARRTAEVIGEAAEYRDDS